MKDITPVQRKAIIAATEDLERAVSAEESKDAVELQTKEQAPEMMWACTPEVKLKASRPSVDVQLTEAQVRGRVIRITRTGSNKIKICSLVSKQDFVDGLEEKRKEEEIKHAKGGTHAIQSGEKDEKRVSDSQK